MRVIVILCNCLFFVLAQAQTSNLCLTQEDYGFIDIRSNIINNLAMNPPANLNEFKIIKINIHFVLRTNGTGNFDEYDDNLGNPRSGYEFAKNITDYMNFFAGYNEQMNIAPNNITPVIPKNFAYALDAVYFIRDDNYFTFSYQQHAPPYATYGIDGNNTMNVFLTYCPNGCRASGFASSVGGNTNKFTENQGYYQRYEAYILDSVNNASINDDFAYVMHGLANNTNHEIGHLLGLSHTVLWYYGAQCPTGASTNTACDDGCGDTPTAWYMVDSLHAAEHPGCSWNRRGFPDIWCTNNNMDYTGGNALTPCQLGIIHTRLGDANDLANYAVCRAVLQPTTICNIGFPKTSYYGSQVTIGGNACRAVSEDLRGEEYATVYFADAVDFYPFEVRDTATFEVIYHKPCP